MSVALYFDQHVPKAIAVGVMERGVDVLPADEDGRADWDDVLLLQRATELGRVIFTQDSDFLVSQRRGRRADASFPAWSTPIN